MNEAEYSAHPGVRRSELWRIHESPEKYKWFKDHPESETPSLAFGSAAHKMLLEPKSFGYEYAIAPNVDRRTKVGKEAWDEFLTESSGKTIISLDEYDQILDMATEVQIHPVASELLHGKKEIPFFWTDPDTGIECKIKCDVLVERDGAVTVVDYKTAANAETNAFNSKIFQYGYHLQAGMYTEGVMRAMGLTERPGFTFIVQEKKPPYSVNVIEVPEEVIQYGVDVFREYIGILRDCEQTGYFYGYTGPFNEPNEAFLPGYLQMGEEDED